MSYREPAKIDVDIYPDGKPVNVPWHKRWFCNPWKDVRVLADTKETSVLQDAFGRRWYLTSSQADTDCWVSMSAPFHFYTGDLECELLIAVLKSHRLEQKAKWTR